MSFYLCQQSETSCGVGQSGGITEWCDEGQWVIMLIMSKAEGECRAPVETVEGLPSYCQRGVGDDGMTDVPIYLYALCTDSHRTESCLELSNDIIGEKECVAVNTYGEGLVGLPVDGRIYFYCRLVLQTWIADVVVLVEGIV